MFALGLLEGLVRAVLGLALDELVGVVEGDVGDVEDLPFGGRLRPDVLDERAVALVKVAELVLVNATRSLAVPDAVLGSWRLIHRVLAEVLHELDVEDVLGVGGVLLDARLQLV